MDAAERALADAEREFSMQRDAFAAQRAELDRREADMQSDGKARLVALTRTRDTLAATYDRAIRNVDQSR